MKNKKKLWPKDRKITCQEYMFQKEAPHTGIISKLLLLNNIFRYKYFI